MRTLYSTLLLSLLMFLSPTALADSPTKAELYDGIEVTVNINTATAEELSALLVGVGDKKAKDIVDYRTENGAFASADDLVSVTWRCDARGTHPHPCKKPRRIFKRALARGLSERETRPALSDPLGPS